MLCGLDVAVMRSMAECNREEELTETLDKLGSSQILIQESCLFGNSGSPLHGLTSAITSTWSESGGLGNQCVEDLGLAITIAGEGEAWFTAWIARVKNSNIWMINWIRILWLCT